MSKLFAKVISRRQKPLIARKELKSRMESSILSGLINLSYREIICLRKQTNTVDLEIFARILFSQIGFKDIFAMFKIQN